MSRLLVVLMTFLALMAMSSPANAYIKGGTERVPVSIKMKTVYIPVNWRIDTGINKGRCSTYGRLGADSMTSAVGGAGFTVKPDTIIYNHYSEGRLVWQGRKIPGGLNVLEQARHSAKPGDYVSLYVKFKVRFAGISVGTKEWRKKVALDGCIV